MADSDIAQVPQGDGQGGSAAAPQPAGPHVSHPPASHPPAESAPADSAPVAAIAQGAGALPPGLVYYAVFLPGPSGVPGAPIYLPAAGYAAPPQGAAAPVWQAGTPPGAAAPVWHTGTPQAASTVAAQAANQRMIVTAIIVAVFVVHLPWLMYLFAVNGCWGSFIEMCSAGADLAAEADAEVDAFSDRPLLFARVTYFILRVQSVLVTDWAQFSNVLQVSTGLGSFMLTRLVAANGMVAQRRLTRVMLAATCATAFVVLFWAEIHLTGTELYPALADETILGYIDQMLPAEFPAYSNIQSNLMQYLQFLRLADALILGAALAIPATARRP